MMDEAVKSHKENSFGWVLTLQQLVVAWRVRLDGLAREQAAEATKSASRRPLAPR